MSLLFRNTTKDSTLAEKARKADNVFTRLIGLLATNQLNQGEGLWLTPCRRIHSIGMRFSFDALFLDKDLVVVKAVEGVPPFRLSESAAAAHSVLELPLGTIAASSTETGDRLQLSE